MPPRPCVTCGRLTSGSRCPAHTVRNGSTRSWRNVRAQVMARDGWTCQLCGAPAQHVDHIRRVADGGADHPANLRALRAGCNLGR